MLYRFSGDSDGADPGFGDLVFDKAGNIYGTASKGGHALGDGVSADALHGGLDR